MSDADNNYPLKPCPFCGASAEFVEYHPEDGCRQTAKEYMVCCTGKGYHQLDYISDKQDLMKVWNERVS